MVEEEAQAPKSPGLASAGLVCDSAHSVRTVSHNLSPGSRTNPPPLPATRTPPQSPATQHEYLLRRQKYKPAAVATAAQIPRRLRRNTNPPTSPTEQNPTSSPSEEGPSKHLCFHPTPTGVGSLKTASKHGKLARPIPRGRETSAQPFAQPNGRRRTRKEHTTPNGRRG